MRVIETVSLRRKGILFEIQFYRCISLATARNRCKKIRFFGTMKRVRVHEAAPLLARQQLFSPLSFPVFFPHPFFFLSSPLLSTPLLSLPALFPHPRTGDAKYTICIASSRKNSGAAFVRTTVGEARRGEAPVSLVSGGSLLKAKQTFSQSQPLWRSNNRFALPSSWPEKLERDRRIRLFDRNARDWKGRLEKKTRQKRVFLPRERNIIHEWVCEWGAAVRRSNRIPHRIPTESHEYFFSRIERL